MSPKLLGEQTDRRTVLKRLAGSAIAVALPIEGHREPIEGFKAGESQEPGSTRKRYLALPLPKSSGQALGLAPLNRYGIPFATGTLDVRSGGIARIPVEASVKQIFLLGMTESDSVHAWADPRNYRVRFFIGDQLGQISLDYVGGGTEIFPLILGESIWWGHSFYQYPGPFPTDVVLQRALAASLRLYPPAPVDDGNYVEVITPKLTPLRSIVIECSPEKLGTVRIAGITVEPAENTEITQAIALPSAALSRQIEKFIEKKTLQLLGQDEHETQDRLTHLRKALYTSDEDFGGRVAEQIPHGYSTPNISFKGEIFAAILANAFRYSLQDIRDKIDADGMYHTSTKGATAWGVDGAQFGTFRKGVGLYYGASWSRDMGRSLEELTTLGGVKECTPCADYCFRMAR